MIHLSVHEKMFFSLFVKCFVPKYNRKLKIIWKLSIKQHIIIFFIFFKFLIVLYENHCGCTLQMIEMYHIRIINTTNIKIPKIRRWSYGVLQPLINLKMALIINVKCFHLIKPKSHYSCKLLVHKNCEIIILDDPIKTSCQTSAALYPDHASSTY